MVLRCTKKILSVIGSKLLAEPAPAPEAEDWYANLLWSGHRKCLLFTLSATLFSVFEADVSTSDLRATRPLVIRLIEREPLYEACHPPRSATWGRRSSSSPRRLTVAFSGA